MPAAPGVSAKSVAESLPAIFHHVFPFDYFNHVQAESFAAFTSSENLVVSAPTGSGKTAIFELAICREILQRTRCPTDKHLDVRSKMRKVVYLAPIRALVAEKSASWTEKFGALDVSVLLVSGEDDDGRVTNEQIAAADIILSTPEKFDGLTRGHPAPCLSIRPEDVGLMLVDEVHHIGDGRGDALEAVVTRAMRASDEQVQKAESCRARIRVVAVSATIPNLHHVAKWLRTSSSNCKTFSQSHRPVPLDFRVLGYRSKNVWTFNTYILSRCFEVVMKYSEGRPTLVFCPSRKLCFLAAKAFVDALKSGKTSSSTSGNPVTKFLSAEEREQLRKSSAQLKDKTNSGLVVHGVGVHHAEVTDEGREQVEKMFRHRLIRVLFTTTTLAQGVNLPARLCVILGTTLYKQGRMTEIDRNLVVQMLGRAGRPNLDTKGMAVVMTSMANVKLYEHICRGSHDHVRSQLEERLPEHLNAQIARGVICDLPSALLWIKATFLYAQRGDQLCGNRSKLDVEMRDTIVKTLRTLSRTKLITFDETELGIEPSKASFTMARYFMTLGAMQLFVTEGQGVTSPCDVLKLLSRAPELTDPLFLRRGEKKILEKLNETLRFPIRKKIETVVDKVFVLWQTNLSSSVTPLEDFNLNAETRKTVLTAKRLARAFAEYLTEAQHPVMFTSCLSAIQVARGAENHMFWDSGSMILQVKGIGPKNAKKLLAAGVHSLKDLDQMDPRRIEGILGRNQPFGDQIHRHLVHVPYLSADLRVENTEGSTSNANIPTGQLQLHLEIFSKEWSAAMRHGLKQEVCCGFLLIGSHGDNVTLYENFALQPATNDQSDKASFTVSVQVNRNKKRSRWLDVIVGPHHFCGVDFHERIHVPRQRDPSESGARADDALLTSTSETAHDMVTVHNHRTRDTPKSSYIQSTEVASSRKPVHDGKNKLDASTRPKTSLDNLDTLRRRARPLTTSLPTKRLRKMSPSQHATRRQKRDLINREFRGTRLAAFIPDEQDDDPPQRFADTKEDTPMSAPTYGEEDVHPILQQPKARQDGHRNESETTCDSYSSIFNYLVNAENEYSAPQRASIFDGVGNDSHMRNTCENLVNSGSISIPSGVLSSCAGGLQERTPDARPAVEMHQVHSDEDHHVSTLRKCG